MVIDPARQRHQVDDDFVGYSHDGIARDIVIADFIDRFVFKDLERLLDAPHVVWRRIDEQVDVLRCPGAAAGDYGKGADERLLWPLLP